MSDVWSDRAFCLRHNWGLPAGVLCVPLCCAVPGVEQQARRLLNVHLLCECVGTCTCSWCTYLLVFMCVYACDVSVCARRLCGRGNFP